MTNQDNPLSQLHQALLKQFNEEELKTLCFTLGIDHQELGGSTHSAKARELVGYAQRHSRLPDLEEAIAQARPRLRPLAIGRFQLTPANSERLVRLLVDLPEFRTADRRVDFLDDLFAGSPRKNDILGGLSLDGLPRGVAVRLITRLTQFGQDEPGHETLLLLVKKLLESIGDGPNADFLRNLLP